MHWKVKYVKIKSELWKHFLGTWSIFVLCLFTFDRFGSSCVVVELAARSWKCRRVQISVAILCCAE